MSPEPVPSSDERAEGGRPARRPAGLGPHCVGTRVVVRRLLRGETGPSGGPAMTDLLGVMTAWDGAGTTVVPEDGVPVVIALGDIVSGKPVPPRPSVRLRVSPEEAERRALAGWPPVHAEPLGEWVLRASAGFSARANSALAVGDPGRPWAEALEEVRAFADRHGLPAWAQVVVGSEADAALVAAGWVPARPSEADTCFQVAGVAQVARSLRSLDEPATRPAASVSATASDLWLSHDARAAAFPEAARAVLEGPEQVAFVTVTDAAGQLVATGRCSLVDDWAGVTDVWVSPEHRRQGQAGVVLRELVGWAAERGARTAYLQTRGDNPAALALYDRLGLRTHHEYRYLAPVRHTL